MIAVPTGVRVWLAGGVTDMRRGMNGLALQVQQGSAAIRMPVICSSSAGAGANDRHSAYRFRRARVAYRWHPLFGRTLQVSHNRRGKDLTCIYTDERPDLGA